MDIVSALSRILGNRVTDEPVELLCYSSDASKVKGSAEAVTWPSDPEEVSAVVRLANDLGFGVVPRGAGTGLSGGAVPMGKDVVLDLSGMKQIIEVDEENMQCLVEPGVVTSDLNKALSKYGLFFPPDPASADACTIGGNIACNAGGIRALKYGMTRNWVARLEVVLPTGEVVWLGSRVKKSVSELDLMGLMIGSEGTLGAVTKAWLGVRPVPPIRKLLAAFFRESSSAGAAVYQIARSGVEPSSAEIMDASTLRAVQGYVDGSFPMPSVMLLVEVDGNAEADVSRRMDTVRRIVGGNGASETWAAEDEMEAEELWKARKAAASALSSLGPSVLIEDISVPVSRIPRMLDAIERISTKHGLPVATFGHAGDGNLHPNLLFDERNEPELEKVKRVSAEIAEASVKLGGSVTGEHGIGVSKIRYLRMEHDDAKLELMKRLKKSLDPNGVMNPGKKGLGDR